MMQILRGSSSRYGERRGKYRPRRQFSSNTSFRIAKREDQSKAVRGGRTEDFLRITFRSFNAPRDDIFFFMGFRVARRKP